jgi:hypothetical protein
VHHLRITTPFLILLVVGPAVLDARPAAAGPAAFGLRGGFSADPETGFFGAHVAMHPSDSLWRLRLEPSLELGFGDDADTLTLRGNLNFKIMFPVSHDAAFYPIIGPYLYYVSRDDGCGDCDRTDAGLNLGLGFAFSGFGMDFTLGLFGDPDFALTLSYTFW